MRYKHRFDDDYLDDHEPKDRKGRWRDQRRAKVMAHETADVDQASVYLKKPFQLDAVGYRR